MIAFPFPRCWSVRILLISLSGFSFLCFGLLDMSAADKPAAPRHGMVVAVSPPGADVGRDVLQHGGNAVDAAVATAFAMAVTYPAAGNIGGGGFMVVYPGKGGGARGHRISAKPLPPRHRRPCSRKARAGTPTNASASPAPCAAWRWLTRSSARLPWKELVAPAVALADDGFPMTSQLAGSLNSFTTGSLPEFSRVFGKPGGANWREGDRLVQPDLAKTLRLIAEQGPDAFYKGPIADLIAAEMKARRRPHHQGRPGPLSPPTNASRSTAPIAATMSTARRRRAPAASASSRCSTSWKTSTSRSRPLVAGDAAPHDRNHAPRLLRSGRATSATATSPRSPPS